MMVNYRVNEYGQPVGLDMLGWIARAKPSGKEIHGQYCHLERLDAEKHGDSLFKAYQQTENYSWTYMAYGPFADRASFDLYLTNITRSEDQIHYAVIDCMKGQALGSLSLMRIDPDNGVLEVGHVIYSDALKHGRIASEAQFLLMGYVFDDLGYRRYEWKCDALNAASRSAASRLGFHFEGIFRNALVYKNRTRDTAWFSIIDEEWPAIKASFVQWLDRSNFDGEGKQIRRLADFR